MAETNAPSTTPMIICPTTHDDWDWQVTFEEYYSNGYYNNGSPTQPVSDILASVVANFQGSGDPYDQFCFSYAEVGYLRQYLTDNQGAAATFQGAGNRFCLLGGGITSPDNQACHGEVFIRNYLTGHEYLRSVGLIDNVFFVAWLPDDFGHDPQLPVLIEALGMSSIGLSRIPGSPQPALCPAKQPANGDVRANGLSFYWPANDGSNVLTHFMPTTYYGVTNTLSNSTMKSASGMQSGVQIFLDNAYDGVVWPGGTIFATAGGDWQFPTSSAAAGTANGAYDWSALIGATISSKSGDVSVTTQLGTFADYYNTLMETPGEIPSMALQAENYWTGYFASRPQLKIDHYKAAQSLLGAETLGSILALRGGTTPGQRLDMDAAIAQGWHLLVPSTHHDFISGTSPDSVYVVGDPTGDTWDSKGQLPMTTKARMLAAEALEAGMTQLADAAEADPIGATEISVVVFNQLGIDLPDTAIVEMEDPRNGTTDYEVRVGASVGQVQRIAGNRLIFQVPGMKSMEYRVVYLIPLDTITAVPEPEDAGAVHMLSNGLVHLELVQDVGWAIKRMMVDGTNRVQSNSDYANRLSLWTDSGNLYQFGMEFLPQGCSNGTFSHSTFMTGASGSVIEKGPIRWRFIGQLTCEVQGVTYNYTTQYDLIKGEKLVRITTIGAAPPAPPVPPGASPVGWSVLVSFPMQTASQGLPAILEYGTSYYWENRNPQGPSWSASGMTFRACRDFAQIATGTVDASGNADPVDAVAAVYHNGIPAWSIDGTIMYGCVLRNAPGTQRGASGTDTDIHMQSYTLDVESQLAVTGYPLQTALYAHTPLHAKPVNMQVPATAPVRAQLACVEQSDAVIRVAKMNTSAEDGRSLILRVQRSGTGTETLDIDLPFLASGGTRVWPSIVTALETIPENPPAVTLSETTASFQADRALWTMKVPITDPDTR